MCFAAPSLHTHGFESWSVQHCGVNLDCLASPLRFRLCAKATAAFSLAAGHGFLLGQAASQETVGISAPLFCFFVVAIENGCFRPPAYLLRCTSPGNFVVLTDCFKIKTCLGLGVSGVGRFFLLVAARHLPDIWLAPAILNLAKRFTDCGWREGVSGVWFSHGGQRFGCVLCVIARQYAF